MNTGLYTYFTYFFSIDFDFADIEENNAEEGSVVVNKQRDRIQTTNAINAATEMADRGMYRFTRF